MFTSKRTLTCIFFSAAEHFPLLTYRQGNGKLIAENTLTAGVCKGFVSCHSLIIFFGLQQRFVRLCEIPCFNSEEFSHMRAANPPCRTASSQHFEAEYTKSSQVISSNLVTSYLPTPTPMDRIINLLGNQRELLLPCSWHCKYSKKSIWPRKRR